MSETTEPTKTKIEVEMEMLEVKNQMSIIAIRDQGSYDYAVEILTAGSEKLKYARALFKRLKDPAYASWKNICAEENLACDPAEKGIKRIKTEILRWDAEQERLRRVEQQRLEAEAREQAEEQRLADAVHMEDQGAPAEVVDAMLSEPVHVAAPVVAPRTYERSSSVTYRSNWVGSCDDLFKLVQYVAKNKQHLNLLQVNGPAINQLAKALKENFSVPGCKAFDDKVIAGRSS